MEKVRKGLNLLIISNGRTDGKGRYRNFENETVEEVLPLVDL